MIILFAVLPAIYTLATALRSARTLENPVTSLAIMKTPRSITALAGAAIFLTQAVPAHAGISWRTPLGRNNLKVDWKHPLGDRPERTLLFVAAATVTAVGVGAIVSSVAAPHLVALGGGFSGSGGSISIGLASRVGAAGVGAGAGVALGRTTPDPKPKLAAPASPPHDPWADLYQIQQGLNSQPTWLASSTFHSVDYMADEISWGSNAWRRDDGPRPRISLSANTDLGPVGEFFLEEGFLTVAKKIPKVGAALHTGLSGYFFLSALLDPVQIGDGTLKVPPLSGLPLLPPKDNSGPKSK